MPSRFASRPQGLRAQCGEGIAERWQNIGPNVTKYRPKHHKISAQTSQKEAQPTQNIGPHITKYWPKHRKILAQISITYRPITWIPWIIWLAKNMHVTRYFNCIILKGYNGFDSLLQRLYIIVHFLKVIFGVMFSIGHHDYRVISNYTFGWSFPASGSWTCFYKN